MYKATRKGFYMVVTFLAPELISSQAYSQWKEAGAATPVMQQLGLDQWSMTHSFFAEMGALAIQFDDGSRQTIDCYLLRQYIEAGSLRIEDMSLSEADIDDRSKSDSFTKTVAVLQSVWFVSQCIARAVQHLALSQLEVATSAYVACAIVTYFFWREKPLDVDCQTVIGKRIDKEKLQLSVWQHRGPSWHPQALGVLGSTQVGGVILYAMGVVFCAVHCIAWNFQFPTDREAYLWRVFAVSSTGAAALMLVLLGYWGVRLLKPALLDGAEGNSLPSAIVQWWIQVVMVPLGLLYFVGRVYLVFAMFYILRSMPSSVYETVDWTVYLPHWM